MGTVDSESPYANDDVQRWLSYRGIMLVDHPVYENKKSLKIPLVCKHLLPDGKCGMYEDRPNVCKEFPPGGPGIPECPYNKDRVEILLK
jgi:Fe-S-cluster containining protein